MHSTLSLFWLLANELRFLKVLDSLLFKYFFYLLIEVSSFSFETDRLTIFHAFVCLFFCMPLLIWPPQPENIVLTLQVKFVPHRIPSCASHPLPSHQAKAKPQFNPQLPTAHLNPPLSHLSSTPWLTTSPHLTTPLTGVLL